MGWADFVLKYRGSILGYLWSFMPPLARFFALLYVFGVLMNVGISQFRLYLFLGLIIWEYFSSTTSGCISMLFEKKSIFRRVAFPRYLFIFVVGFRNTIIFSTHFAIFIFFAYILDSNFTVFTPKILYFVILVLQMNLLAMGIGMILSSYSLKFRDVPHLWHVCLQVLFWLTPIAYAYSVKGPITREALQVIEQGVELSIWSLVGLFVRFQPLSVIIDDARRTILTSSTGSPALEHIIAFTVLYALIFVLGFIIFRRRSRYFLQEY